MQKTRVMVYSCFQLGEPSQAKVEAIPIKKEMILETRDKPKLHNTVFVRARIDGEIQTLVLVYHHNQKTWAVCKKLKKWDCSAVILPIEDPALKPKRKRHTRLSQKANQPA